MRMEKFVVWTLLGILFGGASAILWFFGIMGIVLVPVWYILWAVFFVGYFEDAMPDFKEGDRHGRQG